MSINPLSHSGNSPCPFPLGHLMRAKSGSSAGLGLSKENMWTLINTQPLLLLFLLLRPLLFLKTDDYAISGAKEEEFYDYMEELYAVGPTKPPTRESFKKRVLVSSDGKPLADKDYCNEEMKMKNVHNRFFCVKEHFFLQASYESIRHICYNLFVPCRNNVRKCHRGREIIKAVHCLLISGITMPTCMYKSTYKEGLVLLTCQWENEIGDIIPNHVNDIILV
ncbi:inactive ribonuclease-like protein 9 isoform X1 [Sus scrofa]|uniref:Inactive ribonuclease-like protein 9 n=3 Tax=Sus scrofa TaxID=9823 RepID=A0A8D0YG19_PIG|nr:inactive ribonuclease-like protein 9 isoform X1 [Sus scrofa]